MVNNNLPTHIAIVPDGNRRWAQLHGVSQIEGHQAGADRIHQVVDELIRRQVNYLTVWGFSSDNWKRSQEEVSGIFRLLQLWIERDTPWLDEKGVRLNHIGRMYELPKELQSAIIGAILLTSRNDGLTLTLAFNYCGRAEIIDAINRLLRDWPYDIVVNEPMFSRYLDTRDMPDVDLVIRTANEFRLSNFMLWQTAYSEYYFTPVFWPDFDKLELEKALKTYAERQRRFGGD